MLYTRQIFKLLCDNRYTLRLPGQQALFSQIIHCTLLNDIRNIFFIKRANRLIKKRLAVFCNSN